MQSNLGKIFKTLQAYNVNNNYLIMIVFLLILFN